MSGPLGPFSPLGPLSPMGRPLLEDIVEKLPDAVVVTGTDKSIRSWLGGAPRMFGWAAEEVAGRNVDELLRPRDGNGNPACIGPCDVSSVLGISRGIPEQELLVATKRGSDLWTGVTCTFDRDREGRILHTIVMARDITLRRRIDLTKSEVISAVAHELRSPLTSVKGFTATLLARWDRLDEATKKHLLLTINSDADRVTRLIGELLDISRIESGRLQLSRQMVKIPEIASRVVERIQPRAEHHVIRIGFPDGFPSVFADPDKIEQVLTNLVENAVKYTAGGEVTVSGGRDGDHVRVSVADQGEGIPPEHRSQIFGKFSRRGERTGRPSGTGLGLYISKGLVEAHGGRIWVEGPGLPGSGAVFSFMLPASEPGRPSV
ncbi:MAG: ATP-binding protein [Actinomycetota bacterium]